MILVVKRCCTLILIYLHGLFLTGCVFYSGTPSETQQIKGEVFGSYYLIKYNGELDRQKFQTELDLFFQNFNLEFSTYRPDSVISRFNQAAPGIRIPVSPRFIQMLEFAKDLFVKTEGAFDPTLAPVIKAWGFGGAKNTNIPSASELSAALAKVGMQDVRWSGNEVWKTRNGLMLDVNAFAPGWAADLMGEMLEANNIKNYMVDISGELRIRGEKANNQPWIIGIEKPAKDYAQGVQIALKLRDNSIATSGGYRQFYNQEGLRRSHIIDPRTGKPVTHQISSATVIAADTMIADAWSTAMMVLGEPGISLAEKNGIKVYLLEAQAPGEFKPIIAPAMQEFIKEAALISE